MRAQVQKAVSEIEHGDTFASCMALAAALENIVRLLEEEVPALVISPEPQPVIHPEGERVKTPDPETRAALDILRNEPTKIKRR